MQVVIRLDIQGVASLHLQVVGGCSRTGVS